MLAGTKRRVLHNLWSRIGKNSAAENPAVLQVVDRGIDLIQRVSMRDEVIQLELAFAVPANERRKIPLRAAVSSARSAKRTIAEKQIGVQNRLLVRRRNTDEQSDPSSKKTCVPSFHGSQDLLLSLRQSDC